MPLIPDNGYVSAIVPGQVQGDGKVPGRTAKMSDVERMFDPSRADLVLAARVGWESALGNHEAAAEVLSMLGVEAVAKPSEKAAEKPEKAEKPAKKGKREPLELADPFGD